MLLLLLLLLVLPDFFYNNPSATQAHWLVGAKRFDPAVNDLSCGNNRNFHRVESTRKPQFCVCFENNWRNLSLDKLYTRERSCYGIWIIVHCWEERTKISLGSLGIEDQDLLSAKLEIFYNFSLNLSSIIRIIQIQPKRE